MGRLIMFELSYPYFLLLLPLPWLIRFLPSYRHISSAITIPFFDKLLSSSDKQPSLGAHVVVANSWQQVTIMLTWLLLVIAVTKPIIIGEAISEIKSGRDLMVAVDLSSSMEAKDFSLDNGEQVDRLVMVKSVLKTLSTQRKHDRLGLIVFGSAPYLQVPFTQDHQTWLTLLNETQIAMAGPSTVIGDAIGLSIKLFEQSKTDNRVLILLTDGNDAGSKVPPIEAAKIAKSYGVKIYTIAMGNPKSVGEKKLDLTTLKKIAVITGGKTYQAFKTQELASAYQAISLLEKQEYSSKSFRPKKSLHHIFIALALLANIVLLFRMLYLKQNTNTNPGTRSKTKKIVGQSNV